VFHVTTVTRRATAAACALALAATGTAACSGDEGDPAEPVAAAAAAPEPPFATGRRSLTLVDPTRGTDAVPDKLPARPDRTIEVDVVYPAAGEPGPEPTGDPVGEGDSVVDAPPQDGQFPLVVFAHGFNGRGEIFRALAERWARAGYVVALPTFPLSREGIAVSADLADQPGDVSFILDELGDLSGDDPLAGHVDMEHVAVGGHSLGAATVFGVAYNSCCIDDRVDATIPVSGGTLPFEGGDYDDWPGTPMLLVHGTGDETVPIAAGDAMFELAEAPVWYLRPAGADHAGVFLGEPGRLFEQAALAFLDAHLRGDREALDALAAEVAAGGAAEWRTKP
jgi:dienelactone hydrolase